jgi:hypothetical protein
MKHAGHPALAISRALNAARKRRRPGAVDYQAPIGKFRCQRGAESRQRAVSAWPCLVRISYARRPRSFAGLPSGIWWSSKRLHHDANEDPNARCMVLNETGHL